jgi:hypothetical protein
MPCLGVGDEERANWYVIRANEWGALSAVYSAQSRVKRWPIVVKRTQSKTPAPWGSTTK